MHWCLLLMFALLGCGDGERGVLEGQVAPRFVALGLDGETLGLEQIGPRPSVVVFWASWCGPCMAEVPEIKKVAQSYGERVGILAINMGEDPRQVQTTVDGQGLDYPVALDLDQSLARRFRVGSIPLVLVLDAAGRIRYRGNGLPRRLMVLLDGLLGEE